MTIPAQYPVVIAEGNSATTVWSYNFEVPYQDDGSTPAVLVSTYTDPDVPTVINPSLYTIAGVGVVGGGSVTYPLSGSPLAAGHFIRIERNLAYTQGSAFPNTAFQPDQIEEGLDRLELQIQQIATSAGSGGGGGGGSGVASFNSRTGAVTLFDSDVTGALGFTPVDKAGDTMTGKLNMAAPGSGNVGLNVGVGTDPSGPVNGDLWATTAALKARVGGVTYDLLDVSTTVTLSDLTGRWKALIDYPGIDITGAVNSTTGWNLAIADLNSGLYDTLVLPSGSVKLAGPTTVITRGCSIIGAGIKSSILIGSGADTNPLIHFNIPDRPFHADQVVMSDFRMECIQNRIREAITCSWDGALVDSQTRLTMNNVEIQYGYLSGITVNNCIGGKFRNVNIYGGSYAIDQHAWNITASVGNYGVGLWWTDCEVGGWADAWKGSGHLEGLYWNHCVAGFCRRGITMLMTDTTNTPEFHIEGMTSEVYEYGVYIKNAAYVYISDNSYYLNPALGIPLYAIKVEDIATFTVHDNVAIGGGGVVWDFLKVLGACTSGESHHNTMNNLSGIGHRIAGTSNSIYVLDNNYRNTQTISFPTAIPYSDVSGTNANVQKGVRVYNDVAAGAAPIAFTRTSQAGFLFPTTFGVNNAFQIVTQLAPMVVWGGEEFVVQWAIAVDTPSVDLILQLRIREYNHRPSGPSPYTVFVVNNSRTSINDDRFVPQTITTGKVTRMVGEQTVRIIGSATDALFVLELQTDSGTVICTEAGLWAGGR